MNSSQRLAAQRYAAAYDALSHTNEQAVRREKDLVAGREALARLDAWLINPCVALSEKKQVAQALLKNWPQVGSFVEVLLDAKRYALLPEIVRQVQELLDKRQGIVRAQIVSAQPLTQVQQTHAIHALASRYGKEIKASFQTDKTLLGGLKIWCNGELIDGSISGELARLQEELIK